MRFIISGVLLVLAAIFLAIGWGCNWNWNEMVELLIFLSWIVGIPCLMAGGVGLIFYGIGGPDVFLEFFE